MATKDPKPMAEKEDDNADLEKGEAGDGKRRILVEIVSALCVPTMDAYSDADPHVTAYLKGKKLHKTGVIQDNPNPIWTLETGSLFLIEFAKEEVDLKKDKVSFILKDHSRAMKDEILGTVDVKLSELVKGKGKRREYSMDVPQRIIEFNHKKKRTVTKKTKLVLRFKPPSLEELHFIRTLQKGKDGIFANETFLPPEKSRVKLDDKTGPQLRGWGAKLIATANNPEQDSDTPMIAAMGPSEQWIEVGSGNEGRVYVEVLAMNGLPNMDSPTLKNFKNMTDAFCCLIMEDSIVNTSYIKDTLSPRWMPSDRRAFVFHVHHPSSQLHIGIFDYDKLNRIANNVRKQVHDPIGRVSINLTQFHPNTLYTLQYNIYPIGGEAEKINRAEQNHNGTITVRLRMEWGDTCCNENDAKNMLVAGMRLPPESYVSVPTRHDFQVAHYTTVGGEDPSNFSMQALTAYLEEIQTYVDEDVIATAVEGLFTVLLWRGHWKVQCCCCSFNIPLHSIVAFAWGVLVTQDYNRLLAFFLFGVAWFFLATNEQRRRHPSPWHKCKSYDELLMALLAGTCCGCIGFCQHASATTIRANEDLHLIEPYEAALKEHKEALAKRKALIAQHGSKGHSEQQNELEMGSTVDNPVDFATAQRDSLMGKLNPLKPILHPVQKTLRQVCCCLRVVKSVITWEESYYPFWIVTFSLVGALLVFFIPWGYLLRWLFRILVWAVLGPWMKIVDWVYFGKRKDMTDEEIRDAIQEELHANQKKMLEYRLLTQKMKEKSMKLRSMMKYLFGKFVVRVPRFRDALFCDYPLPASTAEPFENSEADVPIVGQVCGQTLTGDMVPHRMIQEHPCAICEQENSERWESHPELAKEDDNTPPADPPPVGESQPLLSKLRGKKKKKKLFGLFKKLPFIDK